MCQNPRLLPDGTKVACRKCWQCITEFRNDWVGRCIAEQQTAHATNMVTLTYDSSDPFRAAVLHYEDVQAYLARLRVRDRFPCRYLVAGEFGSLKGRTHWHILLFWQTERVPDHLRDWNYNEKHWPHGFSNWTELNERTVRYVCKYITKDLSDEASQRCFRMSKKPPLGAQYFRERALQHVVQGLSIRDRYYSFPWVVDRKGTPVKFGLAGKSLDLFCAAYVEFWKELRGGHWPHSDVLEKWEDQHASYALDPELKPWVPPTKAPHIPPPLGALVEFSEHLNIYYCNVRGRRLFWSFNEDGHRSWENVIRTPSVADRLRAASEKRKDTHVYRTARDGEASEPRRARPEPKSGTRSTR